MHIKTFQGMDEVCLALSDRRDEQAEAIALAERANAAIAKAGERRLPADERRQVVPIMEDQDGTVLIGVVRHLPTRDTADLITTGGAIEHAAGPSFGQRAQIALVLVLGIPAAIGVAYVVAGAFVAGACALIN